MKRNFTLVEFMIVFAIISTLISLLFPSLTRVLSFSSDLQCKSNLRNIGITRSLYSEDNETKFLAWRTRVGPQGPRSYTWWSFLLPYLGIEKEKKWGTTIDEETLNCSVTREGLMTNDYNSHQGYGYNNALSKDRYYGDAPFYCFSRKYSEVADPAKTIEVGDNYRLPGYSYWNGDVRVILNGAHPSFLNNCADVHQGLTQLLWVDGHASSELRYEIQANGRAWYDLK